MTERHLTSINQWLAYHGPDYPRTAEAIRALLTDVEELRALKVGTVIKRRRGAK